MSDEGEAYKSAMSGGLKLKGSVTRKKTALSRALVKEQLEASSLSSSSTQPSLTQPARTKTAAELAHARVLEQRRAQRLKQLAQQSHKEKVQKYNDYLSKLSDHHDMPRIGPG